MLAKSGIDLEDVGVVFGDPNLEIRGWGNDVSWIYTRSHL
jgi:hypothetical protein